MSQLDESAAPAAGGAFTATGDSRARDGVLILCVSSFARLRAIADTVAEALPERRVLFVAAHPPDGERCISLYAGFDSRNASLSLAAETIRSEFGVEPARLYQSDLRYQYHAESEETLVNRTLWILRQAQRIIEENDIGRIFMTGGSSMETNAFFEIADRTPGVRCFRIFPLNYLDVPLSRERFFFTDSNMHRLAGWPEVDRASQRFRSACEEAQRYIDSVRGDRFRPDVFARQQAQTQEFTPDFPGMAVDLAKHLAEIAWAKYKGRPVRNVFIERVRSYFRKAYLDLTRRAPILSDPYFIFVLHDPLESQLLLRGRQFKDQVALCRLLASNMPTGTRLLVKEHPVHPGMVTIADVRRLRKQCPNVQYVDYSFSYRELVKDAKGVITINSTAGLEAAIRGVPVVVLGEGIYRDAPFTRTVADLAELTEALGELLMRPAVPQLDRVRDMLACVLYHSEVSESADDPGIVAAISRGILDRVAR